MSSLTERQQQVLDFIRAHIARHGYPPTLREIGKHMAIRSTNGVNDHLRALDRKGCIHRRDMLSRGIRVVDADSPVQLEAMADAAERAEADLATENKALRLMLQRVFQASTRLPRVTAEMRLLLQDIRGIADGTWQP